MTEYIERKALVHHLENCIDEVNNTNGYTEDFKTCLRLVKNLPAADVEEVKHGKWLNFYNDFSVAECSECADMFEVSPDEEPKKEFLEAFKEFYHYCPNCGAKMDLEDQL